MQPFLKYFKVSILDIDICSQIKSCCFVRLLILLIAMPSPPCQLSVPKYLEELDKFPVLQNNGFSFLIDASGKLFKAGRPSLNDVETNIQAGRFLASVDVVSCVLMSLYFYFPGHRRQWRRWCALPLAVEGSRHTCSELSSSSSMRSTSSFPRAWLAAWSVCKLGPLKWAQHSRGWLLGSYIVCISVQWMLSVCSVLISSYCFKQKPLTIYLRSAGFADLHSGPKAHKSRRPRSSRKHCGAFVNLGCMYLYIIYHIRMCMRENLSFLYQWGFEHPYLSWDMTSVFESFFICI